MAFLDALGLEEVAAEDADTVAGFLSLGTIRIQDAQPEGAVGAFDGAVEDAVRAQSEMAVADFADSFGRKEGRAVLRLEDEVVVAEGVVFGETHVRLLIGP